MKPETIRAEATQTHVALQVMACSMEIFDYRMLRDIYQHFQLQVTPIERDVKKWLGQGLLKGDFISRYGYGRVRVNPERWAELVSHITPDHLQMLLRYPVGEHEKRRTNLTQFLKAFVLFVHDGDFQKPLKWVVWPVVMGSEVVVLEIVHAMMKHGEYAPFLQHLPYQVLVMLFSVNMESQWNSLQPESDSTVLRQAFLDNTLLPEHVRRYFNDSYLYHVELLQTGRIEEILPKLLPDGHFTQTLEAVRMLHRGDVDGAYQLFVQMQKNDNLPVKSFGLFCYGLAMGQTKVRGAKAAAEKLLKSRKAAGSPSHYAMLVALHHYVAGDAADFVKKTPPDVAKNRMAALLAILLLKHYQLVDHQTPYFATAQDVVATCGYDYLRLLYAYDFSALAPLKEKLQASTGLDGSLLPYVRHKEEWEIVMEQLTKLNQRCSNGEKKEPVVRLEQSRVAYVVNMKYYDVQPKLQVSKDGGITWSKGRNIALKNFSHHGVTGMTSQDRRVASMVSAYSDGWYGGVSYELSGIKVIAALVGCQSVFSAVTEQRIEIVEEPLQLSVQPCAGGYTVRSNVDIKQLDNGYYVSQQGDKQVTLTSVSSQQEKTLELLNKIGVFPKQSKEQLTQLLQNLSAHFTVMSPLLKNASDLKHVEANSLIAVQIAPTDRQMFSVRLAVKPFGTQPPCQNPGEGMEIVSTTIKGERVQTERDLKQERENLKALRKRMHDLERAETGVNCWTLDTTQCLELLELVRNATDICYVEWPQGVKMRVVRPVITPDMLKLKISSAGQWFELEGDISIGNKEKLKVSEMMEKLQTAKGNFIRLSDDEYVALSSQLRRHLQAIDTMRMGRGKELKVAAMNGLQLSALEETGAQVEADKQYRQLMQRIKEADTQTFTLPGNIHAELRPYQEEGFRWMSRLAYWGAGACLADDMGLGKTLQSITLLQSRAVLGPQLVVMPTSVLLGWQQELQRFAPALCVKVLNTIGADRKALVSQAGAGDVVLATYGLLVTEGELLAQPVWTTIVLDEAHAIKNRDTQTSKAAMLLKADFRLMLTGTPLQNHLSEIWNLFQFANPGLLGTFQQFTERFMLPIECEHDMERQHLLRRLLSPFLLRRTKDDVLNELPEKTEITMSVELSAEEMALYDNLRQQAIANLEAGTKSALQTLAEITRLRQAACHPRLINPKLPIPSSKTQAFLRLVEELRQNGHRALVFSQFTSHLALISEALDKAAPASTEGNTSDSAAMAERNVNVTPYLYLDGSTSAQERNRLVRQFQTTNVPLFLISLKAGGLGLNLTAADYVIHLDPWWNPAIEDQASDRAHRIGQERPVTVYRLIAAGTIEEKIIRLHQNKRSMADALLQDADMFAQISADEVIALLRQSADTVA